MKILLTAKKGVGKSTVLEKFLKLYQGPVNGFVITRMKDRNNENQGFLSKTMDGRVEILSHKKLIKSNFIIGDNHNVNIDVIDSFLVPEIQKGLASSNLIVIDEIGRMEAISSKFLETIKIALDSEHNILAAIVYEDEPWSLEFKRNLNVKIIEVTIENRDQLPHDIFNMFNT